ncbi:NAD(P)-dependent alcohol dehydrogenase [Arthrobacter castelli]|uniref:NAD(P)-dependent alcohol dehydrogenase n=1 Tax=Arthrobacter castelli TaxID=271431 RepID=UPI00041C2382|nr:NAD(P)-dependent alcohol dehydrogenase [Arthrobacter castelli]
MRAAVNTMYGPPEVVRILDVPAPEPGADEVLVRVRATTVNRTDCAYRAARPWFMRASTGLRRPYRTILGTEYAGDVVAVGGRVTAFGPGDRVFGYLEGRFGAHAELLAVSETSSIARIPEGVDLDLAAASTEGAHYARSAIRRARVQPGERVLVNGATGGIGSAAVQLLVHLRARVTAVCASEHAELVRGLGADLVIDRFAEDFTARPERYDVVLDAVGKSTFGRCRRILLPGGRYVSTEPGPGWQNLPLAGLTALLPGRLSGARRVVFPFPEDGRHVVEEIKGLLASGAFVPVVDRRYGLETIVEAYRYVETGGKVGNVVIRPEPASNTRQ